MLDLIQVQCVIAVSLHFTKPPLANQTPVSELLREYSLSHIIETVWATETNFINTRAERVTLRKRETFARYLHNIVAPRNSAVASKGRVLLSQDESLVALNTFLSNVYLLPFLSVLVHSASVYPT